MKKRLSALIVVLLFMMTFTTYAAQPRLINPTVVLSFDGTTANCSAVVTSAGDRMSLRLELWNGNVLTKSWSATGYSAVTIEGSCRVVKGQTYELLVTGTIGGNSFTSPSVISTC